MMNISFEALSYKVTLGKFWERKSEYQSAHIIVSPLNSKLTFCLSDVIEILKQINGEFRERELSCIVGPSGCGKSSLLNVLSGYLPDYSGIIRVNGSEAKQNTIRSRSSYIMQENKLHEFLTVYETMSFSMKLKIGNRLNGDQQRAKVRTMTV